MKNKNHLEQVPMLMSKISEYTENIEFESIDIISPQGDIEEPQCTGNSCAISISFARRLRLQRNAKAA